MTLNSNDWKTRVPFIQYILCRGQRCRKARKYPTPKRYLQVLGLTNHGSDVLHSKKRVVGYAGPCNVVFFQSTASSPETECGRCEPCYRPEPSGHPRRLCLAKRAHPGSSRQVARSGCCSRPGERLRGRSSLRRCNS